MIELLVVVAIIGILSAIGIVAYRGFIENTKEKQAQTGLQSIYLAQVEYRSINKIYYVASGGCGDQTSNLNNGLFGGDVTLNNDNYRYCISGSSNAFTANAYSKFGGKNFWIKNTNQKSWRLF